MTYFVKAVTVPAVICFSSDEQLTFSVSTSTEFERAPPVVDIALSCFTKYDEGCFYARGGRISILRARMGRLLRHLIIRTYTYEGQMASPQSLFLKIQYPQSIGVLSDKRLDTFLRSIQKVISLARKWILLVHYISGWMLCNISY